MTNKAALFGGALFTAGLAVGAVTQPASGDFTFTNGQVNYGRAAGCRVAGGTLDLLHTASGRSYFAPINYSTDVLHISAWANPTSMGFTHDRDPGDVIWVYSVGAVLAHFGVTEDTTIQLAWDFGAWDRGNSSFIRIQDLTDGSSNYVGVGAGLTTIDLNAGEEYLFMAVSRGSTGGGDSFGTIRGVSCVWDLNGDNLVGTTDLLLLLDAWGDPYDTADLIELLANWGPCPK